MVNMFNDVDNVNHFFASFCFPFTSNHVDKFCLKACDLKTKEFQNSNVIIIVIIIRNQHTRIYYSFFSYIIERQII